MIFLLSKREPSFQPRSTLPVKPAKAEVFYFYEFLDAVMGTLTTKPRLFHATKRSNFVRDQARVDAHHAAFKALRRPPDTADIAAIEVAREPSFFTVEELCFMSKRPTSVEPVKVICLHRDWRSVRPQSPWNYRSKR
jgi:hypothetical protein